MFFGVFIFLSIAISMLATPHFERLFSVGALTAISIVMLFRLMLHWHYRDEAEGDVNQAKDVQESVAWLDDLAKKGEKKE